MVLLEEEVVAAKKPWPSVHGLFATDASVVFLEVAHQASLHITMVGSWGMAQRLPSLEGSWATARQLPQPAQLLEEEVSGWVPPLFSSPDSEMDQSEPTVLEVVPCASSTYML